MTIDYMLDDGEAQPRAAEATRRAAVGLHEIEISRMARCQVAPGEPVVNGIFVKNYIAQSQEFVLCTVALAFPIVTSLRNGNIRQALLLAAVAATFILNMTFVIVSRTALVTMPMLTVELTRWPSTW